MSTLVKYKKLVRKCEALESKIANEPSITGENKEFLEKMLGKSREEMECFRKQLEEEGRTNRRGKKALEEEKGGQEEHGGVDFFKRLPEEIVEMILGCLENCKDLVTCSKASRLFQRILKPNKPVWLFHEILPHVADVTYLEGSDILTCREVCHEWKRAVDYLIESTDLEGLKYTNSYKQAVKADRLRRMMMYVDQVSIKTAGELSRFCDTMKDRVTSLSRQSPFVGRRLSLSVDDEDEELENDDEEQIGQYWSEANRLLELFGGHVWNCHLSLHYLRLNGFVETLRKIFERLPNVKRIDLSASGDIYMCVDADLEELTELEDRLSGEPFPSLPYLVSMDLSGLPRLFFNRIFPLYCRQLRRLELNDAELVFGTSSINSVLPNLTSLKIRFDSGDESRWLQLNCPVLQELSVTIDIDKMEDGFTKLFQVLQHFGLTLRELVVLLTNKFESSPRRIEPAAENSNGHLSSCAELLSLPYLQMLHLEEWTESFNFLVCISSLQYMVIQWTDNDLGHVYSNVREGEVIEIHGFVNRMYESNIWALLPSLMEVKFSSSKCNSDGDVEDEVYYDYSREGYEYFVKNRN